MPRQMLTDEHWSKLKPILLQQGIHDKAELRTTVEGTLDRMRTDCQWRSLPAALVCKRFNAWSAAGKVITAFVSLWNIPMLSGCKRSFYESRDLFTEPGERYVSFTRQADGLMLDLSKQHWRDETLEKLLDLARAAEVPDAISRLLAGERINRSEDRPALHTTLRLPGGRPLGSG